MLIQAIQGVDGDKTAGLLEDPEREFVAATFLKLELLPQPTFHKRKAELEFLEAFFERVTEWREADEAGGRGFDGGQIGSLDRRGRNPRCRRKGAQVRRIHHG